MLEKILIYITFSSEKEAKKIAAKLLETRLIACANIMPPHKAIYEWDDKIKEDKEVLMLAKSTSDKFEAIKLLVEKLHSYELPCILSIDISDGNPEFLNWIEDVTK